MAYWKLGEVDKAKEHLKMAEDLGFFVNPQFKADLQLEQGDWAPRLPLPLEDLHDRIDDQVHEERSAQPLRKKDSLPCTVA